MALGAEGEDRGNFRAGVVRKAQHILRGFHKFAALNLKWEDGERINAPILTDCPVSIECSVVNSIQPGTHELFIGKVEAVHVDEKYLDDSGNILLNKMDLI